MKLAPELKDYYSENYKNGAHVVDGSRMFFNADYINSWLICVVESVIEDPSASSYIPVAVESDFVGNMLSDSVVAISEKAPKKNWFRNKSGKFH